MAKTTKAKTELSPQHLQFCILYVEYKFKGGANRAYKEVYDVDQEKPLSYMVCSAAASRLLKNVNIIAKIKELSDAIENSFTISKAEILNELSKLAFADIRQAFDQYGRLKPIHELPPEIAAAISGIEVDELTEKADGMVIPIGETKKVKFNAKTEAFKLMCDILGYKGVVKVEGDLNINWNETKTYEGK